MTNPFYDSKKLIVSRTGEQAYKDYLARTRDEGKKVGKTKKPKQAITPLDVPSNINKSDYIVIPNTNIVISNYELFKQDKLNWENSHYKLAENGLWMPNAELFMPYFLKVKEASEGKITLQYADGNSVPLGKAQDLWKYLTTNFNSGVWTWLDDKFIETQNQLYHETEHRAVVDNNGNKILKANEVSPLEQCIMEDCYVNLDFNKQGLATTKSSEQEYKQGENIYVWYPRKDCVARFNADLDGASLYCDWDPSVSNRALGVFACAESIPKK